MIQTFDFPTHFSFQMDLDPSFPADNQFITQGIGYEPEITHLLLRVLKPGDRVADVGANVGYFTMMMASLVGRTGHVMAFEPGAANSTKLIHNRQLNGFAQVDVTPQPAWSREEKVTFYLSADDSGGNALWDPGIWPDNPKSREKIDKRELDATTLDAVIGEKKLRLIKLDIEGAEQHALEGADYLMSYYAPAYIVCELNPFALEQMGSSQAFLRTLMIHYGYSTFLLYRNGQMPKLIPPGTTIFPAHITNILFSSPGAVSDAWPEEIMDERLNAR